MKKNNFLLIAMIIIIIIMGCIIYKMMNEKNVAEEKVNTLNQQVSKLEGIMDNLQGQMNTMANTSKTTNEIAANTPKNKKDIKLEGIFENLTNPEVQTYAFEGNSVTYQSLATVKGTYEIIGDKIQINYTESYTPEGTKSDSFPNGQKEELTIIDENTITHSTGKYNKVKIEGKYKNQDELEVISYLFSGNTVTYESLATAKGTYEIIGNKIKINYTEAYTPEGTKADSFPNGQKEELEIVSSNKIVNKNAAFEK